jgi:hypothetical protein
LTICETISPRPNRRPDAKAERIRGMAYIPRT